MRLRLSVKMGVVAGCEGGEKIILEPISMKFRFQEARFVSLGCERDAVKRARKRENKLVAFALRCMARDISTKAKFERMG